MGFDWEEILGEEENIAEAYDERVNKAMEDNDDLYVSGDWNGENVRFKRKWCNHEFSEQEINDLLSGKEIRFRCTVTKNEQDVIGKLEHLEYKGTKYVGFSPSNWKK